MELIGALLLIFFVVSVVCNFVQFFEGLKRKNELSGLKDAKRKLITVEVNLESEQRKVIKLQEQRTDLEDMVYTILKSNFGDAFVLAQFYCRKHCRLDISYRKSLGK